MASFAYLFHPSTNIHSPYTPIFSLLSILLAEHLYVATRAVVRAALNFLPSWSDTVLRKNEFSLKKMWLDRLMQGTKETRSLPDDSDYFDASARALWNGRGGLDEFERATQLVKDAFKTD